MKLSFCDTFYHPLALQLSLLYIRFINTVNCHIKPSISMVAKAFSFGTKRYIYI
jgi:hypothetical protein